MTDLGGRRSQHPLLVARGSPPNRAFAFGRDEPPLQSTRDQFRVGQIQVKTKEAPAF